MAARFPSWVSPLSEIARGVVAHLDRRCTVLVVYYPHYSYGDSPLVALCETN